MEKLVKRSTANKNLSIEWLEKPINFYSIIIGLSITLFTVGYSFGVFKMQFEQKIEKLKIEQKFNERIYDEREKCREYKRKIEEQKIDNLVNAIVELKKIKNDGSSKK